MKAYPLIRWMLFVLLYSLLAQLSFYSRDAWSLSTTLWLPAALLFSVLWLSPFRNWPLWLTTAGLLHIFVGVWTGRPLLLASLFALFDIAIFPLCVLVIRKSPWLLSEPSRHHPVLSEIAWMLRLILCIFCGSLLLSGSLLLAGYPVAPLHLVSWALAALSGVLAVLPWLREQECASPTLRQALQGWQTFSLLAVNMALWGLLYFTPLSHLWQGVTPLFVQLTLLLLSVFTLSGRGLGLLLTCQYLLVMLATQQREGLFFTLTPLLLPALWQAQWYLVFSAILTSCLHQYRLWALRQQARAVGIETLIARFSRTGSGLLFSLEMPERELRWRGSTAALFPGEIDTISTLPLLEAHCDLPFLDAFNQWYASEATAVFEQELSLQRLTGKKLRCLLLIQRSEGETTLTGGISLWLHQETAEESISPTASAAESADDPRACTSLPPQRVPTE